MISLICFLSQGYHFANVTQAFTNVVKQRFPREICDAEKLHSLICLKKLVGIGRCH